jgi:hypothetical protein
MHSRSADNAVSASHLAPALILVVGIFAGLASVYLHQEVRFKSAEMHRVAEAETFYVPPVVVLRALSLGHEPFMADLIHLRGFHYYASHLYSDRRFPYLDAYVDTVVALDPHVRALYRWAAMAAKMGQKITRESVEQAIRYGEMGLEHFPDDWQLYMDIGFNYYYEWRPEFGDREWAKGLARDYFGIAASLPGSSLDPNFVAELFITSNESQVALLHAYTMYLDADEAERDELLNRIMRVENQAAIDELRRRELEWKEDLPFVPRRFFELLGPRPGRVVPESWDAVESVYLTKSALDSDGSGEPAVAPPTSEGEAP